MASVTWFITQRGWKTRRAKGDQAPESTFKETRQRVGFVFLRSRHLLQANTSWRTEPNQPTLRTRVGADLDQVDAFVATLVGTVTQRGPLYGGSDPVAADRQHLDLGPLATHIAKDDPPPVQTADALAASAPDRRQAIVLEHLDRRRDHVLGIAWRAAAIDDELWDIAGKLNKAELAVLVDRRLRALELLQYHVNAGARDDGIGASFVNRTFWYKKWASATTQGRVENMWVDDCDHRVIEPPSVPSSELKDSLPASSILSDPKAHRLSSFVGYEPYTGPHSNFVSVQLPWFENLQTGELDWDLWPGTQVLPIRYATSDDPNNPTDTIKTALSPAQQTWQYWVGPYANPTAIDDAPGYAWILGSDPGIDPALAVSKLFTPAFEWWWKPSLHADGALAAVQLEALRFAEYRRSGSNTEFNMYAKRTTIALDDYFNVRGYHPLPNSPMQPGRAERFENGTAPQDELQIGDQILIESLLPFLLTDWWDYPTVLVSNIDVEPNTGRFAIEGLSVYGFASSEHRLASYRRLVVKFVQDTLDAMRAAILAQFAAGNHPTSMDWDSGRTFSADQSWRADTNLLQQWSPYPHPWDDPKPWWVRIHLDNPLWRRSLNGDVQSLMPLLPKSVAWIDDDHVAVEMAGKVSVFATAPDFVQPPTLDEIPSSHDQPAIPLDPHRCIYVPLFEPFGMFSDGSNPIGWFEFLQSAANRADPTPKLQPVRADGAWVQGISGAPAKVRVIRPRIKKT